MVAAALIKALQARRYDIRPDRRRNSAGADLRSVLYSTINMARFTSLSLNRRIPNMPKRLNGGIASLVRSLTSVRRPEFGHAPGFDDKALTLNPFRHTLRTAAGSRPVFSNKDRAFSASPPLSRPTSLVHDCEKYRFTSGNTLSFQVAKGWQLAVPLPNQGPLR